MMIERGTLFADGRIIYTAATGSASDNSGDGTRNNPYNLFETALNNANDGDTIYILEPKGFVNAADNSPLVISKNITIKGDGTLFMVRKSGIVLDADVTFQNIELGLASRYHDAIFANGHTLTLNNVSCEAGARKVDIFGGGLYINGNAVAPSGNEAIINITGNGVNIGNIYAGSMNGDYSGNVAINLSELNSARNTDVYISGADEPYVNLDDIFNLTEPDAPRPNAGHTISGDVNVTIKNCNIINIEQIADSSCATSTLTVDTDGKFWGTVNIRRIDFLEVIGGGTLAPSECSSTTVVTLKSGSTIDLSNIQIPVLKGLVSDNSLNNRLVLGKDHYLTVNNNISGRFIFETENGYNNHSGNAQYNYAYIRYTNTGDATNGIFTYTCIPGMDMTLDKYNNHTEGGNSYATVWKTSEASEYSPFPITGLTVHNPNITVTENEFKHSVTYNLTVSVSDDVAQNECWFDLVPIQYKVRYMGREYVGEAMFDGYSYYADIPELHMSFMSFSDIDLIDSRICVTTYIPGSGGSIEYPATGVYTISVLPYSEGPQITKTLKLTITDESGDYPQEPTQEPTQELTQEPTQESSQKPTPTPTQESSKKPTQTTEKEPTKRPTQTTEKEPSKRPTQTTEKETSKRPIQTTEKEPSKRPTQTTEEETPKRPTQTTEEETEKESVQSPTQEIENATTQLSTNESGKETTQLSTNESNKETTQLSTKNPVDEPDKKSDDGFSKAVIIAISSVTVIGAGVTTILVIRKKMG